MSDISNSAYIIDSREVIDRIEELESSCLPWRAKLCDFAGIDKEEDFATHEEARNELAGWIRDHALYYDTDLAKADAYEGAAKDAENLSDGETTEFGIGETGLTATIEAVEVDEDDAAELAALKALADEAEGYADDWRYGATLIRETHFVEYVQEMLADVGDLPRDLPGYIAIDWDQTAENIKVDYTEVDFDGVTYLVR